MRKWMMAAFALLVAQPAAFAQSAKEQLPQAKDRGRSAPAVRIRPARERTVVPQLTELQVVLRDQIRSDYTKENSELLYFVAKDVYGPDHNLLIAAGSSAVGRLVRAVKARPFGVAGYVFLICDYVLTNDGTRIPLRAVTLDIRGKDQKNDAAVAGIVAAAAGVGLVNYRGGSDTEKAAVPLIGPIVAAIVTGKNIIVPRGAAFHMSVDADTSVPVPTQYATDDLPELVRPLPIIEEGPVKQVLLRLVDGDFAVGLMHRKGNYLIVTNNVETRKIKMKDVREVHYLNAFGLGGE